jgi:Tfp pilus assembly protein PilV
VEELRVPMTERLVLIGLVILGVGATGLKMLQMDNATGSEVTRRNLRRVCMMLGWTTLTVQAVQGDCPGA